MAVNGFNEEFLGWGREDSELVVRLYKYGLRRRDVSYSAVVFHLWHPENDRVSLVENERLLEQAIHQHAIGASAASKETRAEGVP